MKYLLMVNLSLFSLSNMSIGFCAKPNDRDRRRTGTRRDQSRSNRRIIGHLVGCASVMCKAWRPSNLMNDMAKKIRDFSAARSWIKKHQAQQNNGVIISVPPNIGVAFDESAFGDFRLFCKTELLFECFGEELTPHRP